MRTSKIVASLLLSISALTIASPVSAEKTGAPKDQVPVYRLYNKNTGEHFYTPNARELIHLQNVGWTSEGIGWYSPTSGAPVYRIYNPNANGGDHYYTMNKAEAAYNVSLGWKWDNDSRPAFYSGGDVKNYVAYNPNTVSGAHNYTANNNEQENLLRVGWKYGSVAWSVLKAGSDKINLDQIYNKDLTSIQGLWKNNDGRTLEVVGEQFILDGEVIIDGKDDIWDRVVKNNDSISFSPSGYAMLITSPGFKIFPHDKSDLTQVRIFVGQTGVLENYYYKV